MLALGIVVLAAVLVGRTLAGEPKRSAAVSRWPVCLAFAGAVAFWPQRVQLSRWATAGRRGFVRCILEFRVAQHAGPLAGSGGLEKAHGGLYLAWGQSAVLLVRSEPLYGEQLQLAPRVPHGAVWQALADARLSVQPGPGALHARKSDGENPVRRRSGSTLPCACAGSCPMTLTLAMRPRSSVSPALPCRSFSVWALCLRGTLGGACATAGPAVRNDRKGQHSVG